MASSDWTNDPATPDQVKFIRDLVASKNLTSLTDAQKRWITKGIPQNFTKGQAHKVIEVLKKLEDEFPF